MFCTSCKNKGIPVATIVEIANDLSGVDGPVHGRDSRSPHAVEELRTQLSLDLQHGNAVSDEVRILVRGVPKDALYEDIWDAKERVFGIGSTDPKEIAEAFGWGSWKHQQAELSARDRRLVLGSVDWEPPIHDPGYLEDLLKRHNVDGITISDDPNIRYASPDEIRRSRKQDAVAWGRENTASNPEIRINREKFSGKTRQEIEDILVHEFIHTRMPVGVGHGPEFMDYANTRNISLMGAGNIAEKFKGEVHDSDSPADWPGEGRVPVHVAMMEVQNIDRGSTWIQADYQILAEPGDNRSFPYMEGYSESSRGRLYAFPGTAILRHWQDRGTTPEYFEIGTVAKDGNVSWDCLTYVKPKQEDLDAYVRQGFCPPEFEKEIIRLTPEEESTLWGYMRTYAYPYEQIDKGLGISKFGRWHNNLMDRIASDLTLTMPEKQKLIASTVSSRFVFDDNDVEGPARGDRMVDELRSQIIADRTPEILADIEGRKRAAFMNPVNPGRRDIATSPPGLPYESSRDLKITSPILGDVSEWPRQEVDEELQRDVEEYRTDVSEPMSSVSHGHSEHGWVLKRPRYSGRSGRGRL